LETCVSFWPLLLAIKRQNGSFFFSFNLYYKISFLNIISVTA
jgi:hypothetical protein